MGVSKKKLRQPEEKVLEVNLCLPAAESDAPQGKKRLPGQPRRGTRINVPIREQPSPRSSISKSWNVRMAFVQISGDETLVRASSKINRDAGPILRPISRAPRSKRLMQKNCAVIPTR